MRSKLNASFLYSRSHTNRVGVRVSLVGVLIQVLWAAQARWGGAPAQVDPAAWLQWSAPQETEGCPSGPDFATRVDEHLRAFPRAVADHAHVRVKASIERAWDRQWRAEVRVVDAEGAVVGSRTVANEAASCGPISDALVLVTSLLLSVAGEPADARPPSSTSENVAVISQPRRPSATVKSGSNRWRSSLDAGSSSAIGLLPGVAWSVEVKLAVAPPGWPRLFGTGAFWPETRAGLPGDRGATVRLWTAGVGLCPAFHRTTSRLLSFCLAANVGRFHATGFGFATSESETLGYADAALSGELRHTLVGGLFAEVGGRAAVLLLRPRAVYTTAPGEVDVYRSWPVVALAHFGLGYAFP